MSNKVDEQNTTADVQTYSMPMQGDMVYRKGQCFKISKKELRNMINKSMIPERVERYMNVHKGDVYVKHENGVVFNARKFNKRRK